MINIVCEEIMLGLCLIFIIYQCPWCKVQAIAIRIIASPIRFDRAVIIPALSDREFW